MFRILAERLRQKHRTLDWPAVEPALSPRYQGRPALTDTDCGPCRACTEVCPAGALLPRPDAPGRTPALDMGRCIFCGACARACPRQAIRFGGDYRVAAAERAALVMFPQPPEAAPGQGPEPAATRGHGTAAATPARRDLGLFRRSLRLRQVSAGGCNACEADCNVLGTLVYDLGRFGIEFTASPRHADGLLVTGPVTRAMRAALLDAWAAVPEPRVLIAVGACAISGGLFREGGTCRAGLGPAAPGSGPDDGWPLPPPDVYVPGCPPNPWSILAGILSLRA